MSKSIGNFSGVVLAIGLLAALSGQCEPLPANIESPMPRESLMDSNYALKNFHRLVKLRVNESTTCTGVVMTPAIVATASACIDFAQHPLLISVEPAMHRKKDWKTRGLSVCRGRGDLSQKVSFLVLEKEIIEHDLFTWMVVGTSSEKAPTYVLGFGLYDVFVDTGKLSPVADCPHYDQTADDLWLAGAITNTGDLGAPILRMVQTSYFHLVGLVFEATYNPYILNTTYPCQIEYPALALNLMNTTTLDQFLDQANECEFDSS